MKLSTGCVAFLALCCMTATFAQSPSALLRVDPVELFIGSIVKAEGIATDGIAPLRVIRQTATELLVAGEIYWIDQTLYTFAVELRVEDRNADSLQWRLYLDPEAGMFGSIS